MCVDIIAYKLPKKYIETVLVGSECTPKKNVISTSLQIH